MHIQLLPMWTGSGNNYAYLVSDDRTREAVIIDPANPPEVLPALRKAADDGLKLTAIVNTHHHRDHAGGNAEILKQYPVPIIGGKDCALVSRTPADDETFSLGDIAVRALHTPCHTQDSICFHFRDGDDHAVFTGDTLFIGGCGRFFEGTASEMHAALQKLGTLPDATRVYPGHEYTKSNVAFAVTVARDDAVLALQRAADELPQTPGRFTIGDEKKHNVFMRVDDATIQAAVGEKEPVAVMARLRELKNAS
ncbi:Metallo-hydrolase/oxidoreductase [Trichodelitschia bisporula]|uniref:hydroxyacylglutathione hydrolase n=1 Tax=Trichodelitschia bisporula TaxID=703511 RepID=A0A6G1HR95_9PEZI|nr:Metallo-hydrolase/oxidoreductase [Trichodelitschia bisporula]